MSSGTAAGRSRFRGFDALGQAGQWDRVTADVVRARVGPHPVTKFFTKAEEPCARALLNLLTGQGARVVYKRESLVDGEMPIA